MREIPTYLYIHDYLNPERNFFPLQTTTVLLGGTITLMKFCELLLSLPVAINVINDSIMPSDASERIKDVTSKPVLTHNNCYNHTQLANSDFTTNLTNGTFYSPPTPTEIITNFSINGYCRTAKFFLYSPSRITISIDDARLLSFPGDTLIT